MAGSIQGIGGGGLGAAGVQGTDRGGIRIPSAEGAQGTSFADTLEKAPGEVSELQGEAQDAISAFLRGDPVEIHEVMAATEEAGIALEMLIEVRNKLTEAYRTVINMQN